MRKDLICSKHGLLIFSLFIFLEFFSEILSKIIFSAITYVRRKKRFHHAFKLEAIPETMHVSEGKNYNPNCLSDTITKNSREFIACGHGKKNAALFVQILAVSFTGKLIPLNYDIVLLKGLAFCILHSVPAK